MDLMEALGVQEAKPKATKASAVRRRHALQLIKRAQDGLSAASRHRSVGDWAPGVSDADSAIADQLPEIRARTRDVARCNPIGKAIRKVIGDHVVSHGLEPQLEVDKDRLQISEQQKADWEGEGKAFFERIEPHADSAQRLNFYQLQRLALMSLIDGGDVFVTYPAVRDTDSPVTPRMHLIEAERIDTPPGSAWDPTVSMGVKLGEFGQHLGYFVQRGHPGSNRRIDPNFDFQPTEKRTQSGMRRPNMSQLTDVERVEQNRGVPFLAAALPELDQVTGYLDETLYAARIHNALTIWFETSDPYAAQQAMTQDYDAATDLAEGLLPVGLRFTPPGHTAKLLGPAVPGQYFDPLIVRLMRIVGMPIGVPYEIFSGDVGEANFSSMRHQWQTLKKVVRYLQDLLVVPFERWWRLAMLQGWLDGQWGMKLGFARVQQAPMDWLRVSWQYPAMGYIDPTKEVGAQVEAVKVGLASRSEFIKEDGRDPEEVFTKWEAENKRLGPPEPAPAAPSSMGPQDDENEEPSADGEAEKPQEQDSAPKEEEAVAS